MAENMPSLFDFDDEDFFPTPEKKQDKDIKPKGEQIKKEPAEEAIKQPESSTPDNNEPVAPQNQNEDKVEIPVNEDKAQKALIKPSLELPKPTQSEEATEEGAKENNLYDRQIKAFNFPAKNQAVFTFEPRKEQIKAKRKSDEDDATLQSEAPKEAMPPSQKIADTDEGKTSTDNSEAEKDLPEWSLDKKYYTIGEVAKLFEVNVSHIRFWTTEFRIKTRTTRKGDRLYTPKQIGELRLIHHLVKVKKHTLQGAKEALKQGSMQLEKKLDLKEELQKLYQLLSEIREAL